MIALTLRAFAPVGLLLIGCAAPQQGPAFASPSLVTSLGELGTASGTNETAPQGTLLDALLSNGALTPAQHRELSKDQVASKGKVDSKGKGPDVSMGARGLQVRSADGEYSIRIGGRVQVDGNFHENEGTLDPLINDGTELRRARYAMGGSLPEDLVWFAELDFAGNGSAVKDFWLGKENVHGHNLYVGNQKQPYSLDVEMSSNDIPFVERGVDTALVIPFVDRAVGVRVQNHTEQIYYAAGLYGESVGSGGVDDEGWGLTGRFVGAPVKSDDEVLHLGVRGSFRAPDDGTKSIRIRDETSNMSNFSVVDTGTIAGVDSVTLLGAESVWARGPFSIGGEYNVLTVDQDGRDLQFQSGHAQATYTLTGETHAKAYRLDHGEFKRLRGEGKGDQPWEIAARFATIDLNDGGISGGEQDVYSLGLNWYYSPNLRLMWNWSRVADTDGGPATSDAAEGLDIFTFRAQLNF